MNTQTPAEDPDPEQSEEALLRLHERETRTRGIAQAASTFLLIAGGATLAATVLLPTRVAGASRSARLEWQSRQQEIELARTRAGAEPTDVPSASDAAVGIRPPSAPASAP